MKTSEFARITQLTKIIGTPSSRVQVGIGDDAAVLCPRDKPLLLCTDAMVEGVHFDLSYTSANDLGHKALAACLSDIAAMNGTPLAALFSIAMPAAIETSFIDRFYETATALAKRFNVDIVGGDLTSSPNGLMIDVTCFGETARPILRSGAKPGDIIAVSGTPGASAAGLWALRRDLDAPRLIEAHLRPMPRFDLLKELNRFPDLCTSMIDISDGVASELGHIARKSNVGVTIDASLIPLHGDVKRYAVTHKQDSLNWALHGGEDYELLITLNPERFAEMLEIGGLPGFTRIGQVTPATEGLVIIDADGTPTRLEPRGFDHFASPLPR